LRRLLVFGALALLALCGAAVGYVIHVKHEGRNIRGSATVEFEPNAIETRPRTAGNAARMRSRRTVTAEAGIAWPTYGFDSARLRAVPGVALRPPYRRLWTWHGRALLEFPPAVADGHLYLTTFDGRFYALDARNGRELWRYLSHRCGWASPAVNGDLMIQTFIGHACNAANPGSDGEVIAFDKRTGRIRWRRTIGPTESSPLVAGGLVYVGDWTGRIYALSAQTGATRWTASTDGEVKGSIALAAGRLYVGAYDGHLYALDASTGRRIWRAAGQPRLGAAGTFYSTPAVAYHRAYIGSTDGKVYSFGAESGRLRWSYGTGGYVYASPAIWHQLVLVGSYDQAFYAFDAATGEVRWKFHANGPISGSATVLADIVYFSTFAGRTYALAAATGKELWTWPDGKYSPVVSDGHRLYLTGLGRLYALVEQT
jgi:outer membrane protein assembly factor BamB